MIFILLIVILLVAWALHLMQEAADRREFSLMLAGFLVSAAAAGLMAVYFLVGHYVGYMSQANAAAANLSAYSVDFATELSETDVAEWLSAGDSRMLLPTSTTPTIDR